MRNDELGLGELIAEITPDIFSEVSGQPGATLNIDIRNHGVTPTIEYLILTVTAPTGKIDRSFLVKRALSQAKKNELTDIIYGVSCNTFKIEHALLGRYIKGGCIVPAPIGQAKSKILLAEMIEGDFLDKRLYEARNNEDARAALVEKTILSLCDFHGVGRNVQGDIFLHTDPNEITRKGDIMGRAEHYFLVLSARNKNFLDDVKMSSNGNGSLLERIRDNCRKNFDIFKDYFEVVKKSSQDSQLIHGDMTTYHVIINKDEQIGFIDLGKPKFLPVDYDTTNIYFSQDANLPIDRIRELNIRYLERVAEKITGQKRLNEETEPGKFKSLLLASAFSNIRRGTKSRVLRLGLPDQYQRLVENHPTYADAESYYKDSTLLINRYLISNSTQLGVSEYEIGAISRLSQMIDRELNGQGDLSGMPRKTIPIRDIKSSRPENMGQRAHKAQV